MASRLPGSDTITDLFTPDEIECLIRTAAEAVHGAALSEDSLSSRQVELAARAYNALQADDEPDDGADRQGHPAPVTEHPHDDEPDVVRARVRWSEIVTREAVRDLDAARMRRLGYDPRDPDSVKRYLQDADDFDGDDWYPWHAEYGEHARHIDTDNAEISAVTIEP